MFDETRLIFDRLAHHLGDKLTFYHDVDEVLSTLDILVYAYLKYQLVNTNESKEVTLLRQSQSYANLFEFVRLIDNRLQNFEQDIEEDDILPEIEELADPSKWLKTHFD